ncbi:hypothetical protein DNK47_02770 [Mycoplasma wenyonii]|uniref:Uncharacterized protein n=1 Tax=Mycoplasma wenyonii TaxID=65123 RepID=A0A328PP24_9MOLU|nr:hypothetical protein [Mycoplasma wenyonii]RAO94866.1 hypothetical protein DNK47_02770 [Mycoplasma wenyonii]
MKDKEEIAMHLYEAREQKNITPFYSKVWGPDLYNNEDTRFLVEVVSEYPTVHEYQIFTWSWKYKALVWDLSCYEPKSKATIGPVVQYPSYSLWALKGPKTIDGKCIPKDINGYRNYWGSYIDSHFTDTYRDFETIKEKVLNNTNINKGSIKIFDKNNPLPFFYIGWGGKEGSDSWKVGNVSPIYWSKKELKFFHSKEDQAQDYTEIKTYGDYKKALNIA